MMSLSLSPAVFLDRDGTIIEDRGHLSSPSQVEFFPHAVQSLQKLQESFKLFIVTNHPLAMALIREAGVPLAAPSANPFGRVSPTTAGHVREQLGQDVDVVLDGGPCRVGIESTILSLVDGQAVLLRPGGLAVEDIETIIGPVARTDCTASRLYDAIVTYCHLLSQRPAAGGGAANRGVAKACDLTQRAAGGCLRPFFEAGDEI